MSESGPATPASIVDALKAVAGNPPKVRASFAKGRCVRGTYTPSDQAEEITKSLSFTRPSSVLARFSVGGGNPKVADTNNLVLRGFSFKLGDDDHRSDILVESAPVHFARTLDQMLAFLKVRIPGPDGKPDMEKVKAFSAANPETLNQANYVAARQLPASFVGTTYWGVHSFPATNSKGQTTVYQIQGRPSRRRPDTDRGRGQDEISRLPSRRPRTPDRCRRCSVQRDGAARPSRRPHHGRDRALAGRR
jgi:catalase